MKLFNVLIAVLSLLFALFGCSKGKSNPVVADTPSDSFYGTLQQGSLPVIAFDGTSAIGLLWSFEMSVTSGGADLHMMPARSSFIGESFVVSGDAFFTTTPCRDCLRIDRFGMDQDQNIIVGLSIKHPFEMGNPGEPPSGTNRLDLDIFDVALVINPLDTTPSTYALTDAEVFSGIVLNPDGYTSELTEVIGDSALRPFKICYLNPDNNRFEMGTGRSDFEVLLSQDILHFEMYVTMGYGASAKRLDRLNPEYYIPEFNRKAAWKVDVSADPWFNSYPNIVTIDVYDWNHNATISDNFPDSENPDHIRASTDIAEVTVEVPGMTDRIITAITTDTSTNGWDDPITYTATFANENALDEGEYIGLVKVLDTRVPGEVIEGGESDTLVDTLDGIELVWLTVPEFATYQTFKAIVDNDLCGPITGEIVSPECPVSGVYNGQTIDFNVFATSAGHGNPIVQYESDWDYDGSIFDTDATSPDGFFANSGPFINPNCGGSNDPVTYTVAFRATDSCDPPNVTIFATCDLTVEYCCGPITGEILSPSCPVIDHKRGDTIDFSVFATSPNGGDPIYMYQADWDYDGLVFDNDAWNNDGIFDNAGPFINPNCDSSGEPVTYTVAFRGFDSCVPPNITIFATCEVTVICSGPYGWGKAWGGHIHEQFMDVGADSYGSVFVCGSFGATVDFDPGPGSYIRTAIGKDDCYLSKFDSWGEFSGARTWGGTQKDYAYSVAVDYNQNVFVTGNFEDIADFDPGPESEIRSANGPRDIFLSKFDNNGSFQWVNTWGGSKGHETEEGRQVEVDYMGNVFVEGRFSLSIDFDPGPGVDETIGWSGDFLSKFDSNGNYYWAKRWQSSASCDNPGFTIDGSGNIYLADHTDSYVFFLAKLSNSGNIEWYITDVVLGQALIADNYGNLYQAGRFALGRDFDPGPGEDYHQAGLIDKAFVTKFDIDHNYYWTQTWAAADNSTPVESRAIDVNDSGEIFVAGVFSGLVDFDPGPGEEWHQSNGLNKDIFLSKFMPDGSFSWVRTWGSNLRERPYAVDVDDQGNIYLVGNFEGTMDFDPGPGEYWLTPEWDHGNFLIKLLPNGYWE